jgi:hypothetical protein
LHAVGRGTAWDGRRNTSRRIEVPLGAYLAALGVVAAFRAREPALARWIEDGAPGLSEAGHVARFGAAYPAKSI